MLWQSVAVLPAYAGAAPLITASASMEIAKAFICILLKSIGVGLDARLRMHIVLGSVGQ